ncbi:MAG: hypothetical protein JNM57_12835 [Cyclobacteriaceae bacterium]|nr:hypothetical protein [Cyclobacteriaceae bacterium]
MSSPLLLSAQVGFVVTTLIYIRLLLQEFRFGIQQTSRSEEKKKSLYRNIVIALIGWAAFTGIWSLSGIFGNFSLFPFNAVPILLIPLIVVMWLTFSKTGVEITRFITPARLVRLQSFRILVELLLWALLLAHVVPIQMTFEGRNFDILVGLTAPVVAYLVVRNKIARTILIVWNVLGLALLINIVATAILSMPVPFRIFMNEPANTIVTTFPVSLLPSFLVPMAYFLHFLSLRQLLTGKNT